MLAAAGSAVLVSLAWVPVRQRWPNVDVALALVVVVAAWGLTGRRASVVAAAVSSAASFAFFDTRPYERWVISRQPDIATLAVLVVVSAVMGELAARAAHNRRPAGRAGRDMASVREIAALVSAGEELVAVIGHVASSLDRLLAGRGCSYEAGEPLPGALLVGPDGRAARLPGGLAAGARFGRRARRRVTVEVPVHGLGRVLGRFIVTDADSDALRDGRSLVALTLADQVGAALIAQAPESAVDHEAAGAAADAPRPVLRVVD